MRALKKLIKIALEFPEQIYWNVKGHCRCIIEAIPSCESYCFYFEDKDKTNLASTICKNKMLRKEYEILKGVYSNKSFRVFNEEFPLTYKGDWFYPRKTPILYNYFKNVLIPENYDIKTAWEINRLQHLPPLALIYMVEDQEWIKRLIFSQISDWERKNPYKLGINWLSALEVGLRALSLVWTFFLLDKEKMSRREISRFLRLLQKHGKFVAENLSLHKEFPNNHLIGEAACLGILAISCPFFTEAAKWFETADRILLDNLYIQFFDDGGHKEQAFGYHRFVLDLYVHYFCLVRKAAGNVDHKVLERIGLMFEYLYCCLKPDLTSPNTGDNDDAAVLKISGGRNSYEACLGNCAMFLNRKESLWDKETINLQTYLLFGNEIFCRQEKRREAEGKNMKSVAFPSSGVFLMEFREKDCEYYLNFSCGPSGWGEAGHKHADCLSFGLYAYGNTLIADSGTYRYNGVCEWRSFFRGTSAHNTITIDGLDQAEPVKLPDPFGWKKQVAGKLNCWHTSNLFDFVDGQHDGYERFEEGVIHRRKILFVKGEYWIVFDGITGKGCHEIDCYFHLGPAKAFLNSIDKSVCADFGGGVSLKIIPLAVGSLEAEVIEGRKKPIQGWVSLEYGQKTEAPVLCYRRKAAVPCVLGTILYPYRHTQQIVNIEDLCENGLRREYLFRAYKVRWTGEKCDVIMMSQIEGIKRFGEYVTDSELIFLRRENNEYTRVLMKSGTFLRKGGEAILKFDGVRDFVEITNLI